ncbi:MAG: DNA internalization-related competence protein ComEC/Rec2 [Deltaproteobacteria bacterium]|nr:DNA internalization-related competence protein ComEC/Rec2 [Deltaproteobacteria bacterium]
MRLLPLLAFAQALGIWVADRGWLGLEVAVASGLTLLVAVFALRPRPAQLRALSLALAFLAGAVSLAVQLRVAAVTRLPSESVAIEATAVDVVSGPGWWRVDVENVRAVDPRSSRLPERIRLIGGDTPAGFQGLEDANRGERIRALVSLRVLHEPRNPGSPSRIRSLERRGIGALGRLPHPALHVTLADRSTRSPMRAVRGLRREISGKLAAAGAGSSLVRALSLGDRAGLSSEVREAFRRLGVSHLLAVSGLHLGLVASLVFSLVRGSVGNCAWLAARCDTRHIALGVGVLAAIVYALFSGWGIPVRRALVFLLVLVLMVARGRSGHRAEPLAAAAIAVLGVEPGALFDPGAQLSFAATAALMFAAPRPGSGEFGAFESRSRFIEDAARASASAVAVTAPIAAWQLGSAAPLALFVNLVAIPWTAFALLPLSLTASLALGCGLDLVGGGLASAAVWIANGTLELGLWFADRLPVAIPSPRPSGVFIFAIVLCVVLTLRARATAPRILGSFVVSVLIAVAPPAPLAPPTPRFIALEVGQGSASLVEGHAAAVLIDAGSSFGGRDWGKRAVVPSLAALGVEHLDVLIVSHGDLDHWGGVPSVLNSVSVGEIWVPYGAAADPAFDPIRNAARSRRIPVLERGAGSPTTVVGDLLIEPLWPLQTAERRSRNDRSLVVRIEVNGRSVLLPGDLEAAAESDLVASGADLRADVLALAHHGSRTSSTEIFLDAVGAAVAIASAPCRSRFEMPHADVLARAEEAGFAVWWTGRDGAVMVGLGERITAWGYGDRMDPDACRSH